MATFLRILYWTDTSLPLSDTLEFEGQEPPVDVDTLRVWMWDTAAMFVGRLWQDTLLLPDQPEKDK